MASNQPPPPPKTTAPSDATVPAPAPSLSVVQVQPPPPPKIPAVPGMPPLGLSTAMTDEAIEIFHANCRKSPTDNQPWTHSTWECMCIRCKKCKPHGSNPCTEKQPGWAGKDKNWSMIATAMGWPTEEKPRRLCRFCYYEWAAIAEAAQVTRLQQSDNASHTLAADNTSDEDALGRLSRRIEELEKIVEHWQAEVRFLKSMIELQATHTASSSSASNDNTWQ